MRLLIVVTLTSSVIAGLAAYIVAYDRACACGHRGEAGRWALRAIPGNKNRGREYWGRHPSPRQGDQAPKPLIPNLTSA